MTLRERRIARQHLAGNHADCDRETCAALRRPQWVQRAEERRLPAKELVA